METATLTYGEADLTQEDSRLSLLMKCPECGHRFHVKLEEKDLTGTERISSTMPGRSVRGVSSGPGELTYDIQDYRYTYKCERCGHEWSETGIKEEPEQDRP